MARHKNTEWTLADTESYPGAQLAVLMDIRDELKEIKELLRPLQRLNCPDFLRIPRKLDRIGRNTERRKKLSTTKPKNEPK